MFPIFRHLEECWKVAPKSNLNKISKHTLGSTPQPWSSEAINFSKCHKYIDENCRILWVRGLRWGSCMLTGSMQRFLPLWISSIFWSRKLPCGSASVVHRKQSNNTEGENNCAYLHHGQPLDFEQLHSHLSFRGVLDSEMCSSGESFGSF